MKIAVDLDDILSDTLEAFIRFHNKNYKTKLKFEDFTSYDLQDVIGISMEEEARRLEEFDKSSYFDLLKPVKNSQKAIRQLSKNHELVVVTARTPRVSGKTKRWLKKYFPEIGEVIFISTDYRGYVRKKSEVCLELSAEVLIEDKKYFIEECAKAGIKVIKLEYPWNKGIKKNKKIISVKSWEEILKIVN